MIWADGAVLCAISILRKLNRIGSIRTLLDAVIIKKNIGEFALKTNSFLADQARLQAISAYPINVIGHIARRALF